MRVLSLICLFVLVGCSVQKQVGHDYQRDSVNIFTKVTYKDSIIYHIIEQESDKAIVPDTDTSRLSTTYAESEAYVKSGKLHHTLRNKSEAVIPLKIQIPVQYVNATKINARNVREIVEVEKQLSKWQQFIMTFGYIAFGVIIGWLLLKLKRLFI